MALSFAGAFHAGKFGISVSTPAALVFTRFLIAAFFLFPFVIGQRKKDYIPKAQDLPLIFILGLTGIFLYNYLFFRALETTSAVNASVLGALGPLLTSVMATLWAREHLGWTRFWALLLALSGVLLALSKGNWTILINLRFNAGDLYMLAAILFLSIYNVLSKKALLRFSPLSILFLTVIAALLIDLPLFLAERPWSSLPFHSVGFWASVTYMAICATAGGFLFLQIGIRNIGVNRSIPFVNLTSVFTMLIALFLHGQSALSWVHIVSASAIITGIVINSRLK